MGNYTGAISTFNAVQPKTRDEYAWYNLGITHMYGGHLSRQGSIGAAIDNLNKALQSINPDRGLQYLMR